MERLTHTIRASHTNMALTSNEPDHRRSAPTPNEMRCLQDELQIAYRNANHKRQPAQQKPASSLPMRPKRNCLRFFILHHFTMITEQNILLTKHKWILKRDSALKQLFLFLFYAYRYPLLQLLPLYIYTTYQRIRYSHYKCSYLSVTYLSLPHFVERAVGD